MIDARNLSKSYAVTRAVDDISFHVEKGEILGFLGPNGAGKTTTMRMLTCFMPPTSGTATVAGFDIFRQSLDVRRIVGYLPENVPLYPDMRVGEYLDYRARLKGVPRRTRRARLNDVMEKTLVADVRHRIIGQLSKGYRQRVGLAEALIHDPKVLILDEPTIGLDPNQVRQVRALIKQLGGEYTILLSTHILPEVEAICGRVIIIDHGRIVAMDTPENLIRNIRGGTRLALEVRGPGEEIRQAIAKIPGVEKVERSGNGVSVLTVEVRQGADVREEIARLIADRRWGLREMKKQTVTLEDIFVHITMHEQDND
jgi:ABC-2 type transport system ATP-binding protein